MGKNIRKGVLRRDSVLNCTLRLGVLEVFKENSSPIWSVDWNPSGTQIALGHNHVKIRIWDTESNPLRLLDGHSAEISAISHSKDSTQPALGFADGIIRYYNLTNLIHLLKFRTFI